MFSKEDFTPENAQRLTVIINSRMGHPPLTPFREHIPAQQKKFNRVMNEYIKALPEDWMPVLLQDFNTIVSEDILNEDFDPSKIFVYAQDKELLLTEEQKEQYDKGELFLSEDYQAIVAK
jgi:hypothetical protein